MDEKLLGALNNLSDALSEIADLMSQKSSEKDSDASKALIGGDLTEQINGINEGIKSIKSDTTKILSNQETIIGMSKEKGDKDDIAAKVGGDANKQSMIKDGLSTILLIGVAVVALGAAFNLIGDVDFGSVIALSIAIPILALSFMKVNEKMKESKFDPKKDGINLLLTMLGISLAVVASSFILGFVQPVGFAQLGTAILISGMFAAIGFSLSSILKGFKGVSMGDALKSSLLMPLIFPAIAAAIVGSSYLLGQVQPVGFIQLLTSFAISILFVPLGFAAGLMLKSFKDISPGAAIAMMVSVPIVMIGLSYAIVESSKLLSGVYTIGLGQFITALAISILFIPLAFAAGLLVKKMKGIGIKEMVMLPITMVLLSGAVMLSSHILAETADIDGSKLWNLVLVGITLAAIGIALGGAMVLMSKMGGIKDYLIGGVATLIVAGTIMISSHILSLGNYSGFPSTDWASGVGLSMLAFGLPILVFGMAILATGGIGLLAVAGGAIAALMIAGTITATSHILATGAYGAFPPSDWVYGVGESMLVFGLPILLLGAAILLSAGLGLLAIYAGAEGALSIANTIVGVSHILSGGSYGNGPSTDWAKATSLLLLAFAPAVVALGVLSAIPFVGGAILEGGSEAVLGISRTIVQASYILGAGSYGGGPTVEWAAGISIALGAFSPIYSILAANTGLFSSGVSPEDFSTAIRTVSGGIVDAASFFAENSASFDPSTAPSKEWAEGVGLALGAFSPVYKILTENDSLFSSGVSPEDFTAAIKTVSVGIVSAAGFFAANSASFDPSKAPSKEWAEGVGTAIESFSKVYEIIEDNDFLSDPKEMKEINKGLSSITWGIINTARRFGNSGASFEEGSYPSKSWGEGVLASFESFYEIIELLEDEGTGGTWRVYNMANVMTGVARRFSYDPEMWDSYPNQDWIDGVGSVMVGFAIMSGSEDLEIFDEEWTKWRLYRVVNTMINVARKFSAEPDIWQAYPGSSWVEGMSTAIEGFAKISSNISDDDMDAFRGGLFGDSPIDKIADGMYKVAGAYDKLGEAVSKFNISLTGMDLDKVNAFRMLTNNIAVLSAMDSNMFSDMMETLEDNTGVFSQLLVEQTKQDNAKASVGETETSSPAGSPEEDQNRMLSEKIDAMIELLSNISGSNSSIDEHLLSQMDNKNKELI